MCATLNTIPYSIKCPIDTKHEGSRSELTPYEDQQETIMKSISLKSLIAAIAIAASVAACTTTTPTSGEDFAADAVGNVNGGSGN